MISSIWLMAVIIVFIPYSRKIIQLYTCFWLFGFGSGVYVNVKYVWLIDMWQTNSAPVLHLAGFMFGIGHTLGPLIEKPYLTGEQPLTVNTNQMSDQLINESELRRNKLHIPYLICGLIVSIGIPFLIGITKEFYSGEGVMGGVKMVAFHSLNAQIFLNSKERVFASFLS